MTGHVLHTNIDDIFVNTLPGNTNKLLVDFRWFWRYVIINASGGLDWHEWWHWHLCTNCRNMFCLFGWSSDQNGRHFAVNISIAFSWMKRFVFLFLISLMFVLNGPMNNKSNKSALVLSDGLVPTWKYDYQMTWRQMVNANLCRLKKFSNHSLSNNVLYLRPCWLAISTTVGSNISFNRNNIIVQMFSFKYMLLILSSANGMGMDGICFLLWNRINLTDSQREGQSSALGLTIYKLTDWGRDKMADIFQTTFSNAFSLLKMWQFRLRFHWSVFPRVKLTIFHIGSDDGLVPSRRQAIIWTNDD